MDTASGVGVALLGLDLTSVTASEASARSTTTLVMKVTMSSDASLKDKCDYLGVELPHGWGNVIMGAASLGSATLSGTDTDGTALVTGLAVELDLAAVSRRSVKVLVKKTVDATDGTSTANWLQLGAAYTLTLANVPTPNTASGQWGQVKVTVGGAAATKGGLATSHDCTVTTGLTDK